MTPFEVRQKWPRVLRAVEAYVGNYNLAARYIAKARTHEKLYVLIVSEAYARRHSGKRRAG